MTALLLRLAAAALAILVTLTGCGSSQGLTGRYVDDTMTMVAEVRAALDSSVEDDDHRSLERHTRALMNDYISRYRRNDSIKVLGSFTTMQTSLNSLAGHYANFENRPIPEKLRNRLQHELDDVERGVTKGA